MFRTGPLDRDDLAASPHARGDVPAFVLLWPIFLRFSPRPWGCSAARSWSRQVRYLLPTPVGMFRNTSRDRSAQRPSPHARGDVPFILVDIPPPQSFSPRPWGCSFRRCLLRRRVPLLPTPVGMFRSRRTSTASPMSSPHARGDVPTLFHVIEGLRFFSPRPWGCSF